MRAGTSSGWETGLVTGLQEGGCVDEELEDTREELLFPMGW